MHALYEVHALYGGLMLKTVPKKLYLMIIGGHDLRGCHAFTDCSIVQWFPNRSDPKEIFIASPGPTCKTKYILITGVLS